MKSKAVLAPLALTALLATSTSAAEPDFYLMMEKCKTTVGHLVVSDESLKVLDGDPATLGCYRQSADVSCVLAMEGGVEGHKGSQIQYKIVTDSPPKLILSDKSGGEFISIDTTQRAAVVITRILGLEFAASKVCHGLYATSFDIKALDK
jgi:hypothetical protein